MGCFIDKRLYDLILSSLDMQWCYETAGNKQDMVFMVNDRWMRDTAVVENIIRRDGLWKIFLIFAHYKNPLLLIRREISACFSKSTALVYGQYMRRIAAKDPRGTLEVDIRDFTIHLN